MKFFSFLIIIILSSSVINAQNFQIHQYKIRASSESIQKVNNFYDSIVSITNFNKSTGHTTSPAVKKDTTIINKLFKIYKENLTESDISDSKYLVGDSILMGLRLYNTQNKFLTKIQSPKPFSIFNCNKYNTDTINFYLSGQSNIAVFQNITLQNFSEKSVLNAELGTFYFGLMRLGVTGSFSSKTDSSKEKSNKTNLQQILYNGGNFGLNFSLPIFLTRDRSDQVHFGIFAQSNFGLNPGFDSTSKSTNFSNNLLFTNQTGFNLHFDVGSNDKKARLFFDIPTYYSWGSKETYKSLGISDYSIVKLQVGASLGDLVNFKISGPLLSSSKIMQQLPYIISFSFSPFNL